MTSRNSLIKVTSRQMLDVHWVAGALGRGRV